MQIDKIGLPKMYSKEYWFPQDTFGQKVYLVKQAWKVLYSISFY